MIKSKVFWLNLGNFVYFLYQMLFYRHSVVAVFET